MKPFHNAGRLSLFATLAAIALLSFTGMAFADSGNGGSSLNSPTQWAIYGETTQPNGNLNFHPIGHGMSFAVPDATASSPTFVNYMLDTYTVSLTESNTITASFTVTTSSTTTAIQGDPLWTTEYGSPITPAFVRLFIQSNLPADGTATCVPGNSNEGNYWWADVDSYTFVNGGTGGTITMTVSLNNANWSGICGNAAGSNQAGFDNALANIKYVGISFGSGYFFASGVGVDGSTGTATFTLTNYAIS